LGLLASKRGCLQRVLLSGNRASSHSTMAIESG
jgi:hypothetical protein